MSYLEFYALEFPWFSVCWPGLTRYDYDIESDCVHFRYGINPSDIGILLPKWLCMLREECIRDDGDFGYIHSSSMDRRLWYR